MDLKDILEKVNSLPVEERAIIAESLLRSLNPPESDVDKKWAALAEKRLSELRSGETKGVPGKEVFNRIWRRFNK